MPIKIFTLILLFSISPYSIAVEKIVIVGLFKDKAIVELDGKQRILIAGKTSPEGVTLISADSKEAVLEIDGEQKTYTLGTHIGSSFNAASEGTIVTIAPDENGHYFVNGSINGFQVNFVVDTGATLIAMNRNQAKRLGLNYKLDGEEGRSHTAAGIAKIYLVKLKKVKVGDIELRDIEGAVHDSDFPEIILLGNSFLSKVDMNREGRILQLQKK
ncbi:MAG: aspartyl protease [Gammaproteobacteria bacterium]|nr:aspartyl protease [Gammaproteobacteria bacterium]